MAQLIDKDALVAEIEKRIKKLQDLFKEGEKKLDSFQKTAILLCIDECKVVLNILDTLEVKEGDLYHELDKYFEQFKGLEKINWNWRIDSVNIHAQGIYDFARHFYELGLQVNNPVTAADRGFAEEIIINLKRVENDYHLDLTREMEWLRNKTKKGE